jgi:exonuclease-1
MGISGLLGFVKPITKKISLSTFSGKTAAVDGYCLLHKGAVLCAEELITGQETSRYFAFNPCNYLYKLASL